MNAFCSPGGDAKPEELGGNDLASTDLRLRRANTKLTIPAMRTAAPPIAMPAIAPGLRAGLDESEAGDVLFALAEAVEVTEIVVGVKAVGVAVEDTPDGAADTMPLAVRLT